jgi:hypothetical protein
MTCLEAILSELGVRQLIVAAITPLKRMWQKAFGFTSLTVEEAAAVDDYLVSPDPETCVLMRKPLGAQAKHEDTLTASVASARQAVCQKLAEHAKRRQCSQSQVRLACFLATSCLYIMPFDSASLRLQWRKWLLSMITWSRPTLRRVF